MTTSFTTSDEFDPQDGGFDDEVEYPELFGITFTPNVTGISIGVGGLLIAAYLFWSQVMPTFTSLSELGKTREEKQEQLDKISKNQYERIIARKKSQLSEAENLKQDVLQLFTTEETLETLLLDISTYANLSNITLNSYNPANNKRELGDNSLGSVANGNVQVETFELNIQGTFAQTQLFLQDLERLQPLLVIQDFRSSTLDNTVYLFEDNKLTTVGEPRVLTTITMQAVFANVKPPPENNPDEDKK